MNFKYVLFFLFVLSNTATAQKLPAKKKTLKTMRLANAYFMNAWPDPGKSIITNRERPSNIWTRAVYYEGLMALHKIDPQKKYYDYAVDWGEKHKWGMRSGIKTRNADDQLAICGGGMLILIRYTKSQTAKIAIGAVAMDG